MRQPNNNALAVSFACADTVTVGAFVEISGDLTVAVPTAAGSTKVVGRVDQKIASTDLTRPSTRCTVVTPFNLRDNETYLCGEALAVGPVVVGGNGKLYGYTAGSAATITGTEVEPFLPVADTTDTLKIKVGANGTSQTFTLAATDITAALVAAKINATAVGFRADATADKKVKLTSLSVGTPLEIEAVATDDYTELGLAAGAVDGVAPSGDPRAVVGLCIKHTTAADQIPDVLLY